MAAWAAALIAAGVGKSGSPAPKSITSTPSRRRRSTVAVTFIVGELAIRPVRAARRGVMTASSFLLGPGDLLLEPAFDHVGNEAVDAAAESEHLFDQPGADVAVLLGRHHEDSLNITIQTPVH